MIMRASSLISGKELVAVLFADGRGNEKGMERMVDRDWTAWEISAGRDDLGRRSSKYIKGTDKRKVEDTLTYGVKLEI